MLTAEEQRELEAIDSYLAPRDELMIQLHGLIQEYERNIAQVSSVTQADLAALDVELRDIERDFEDAVTKAETSKIRQSIADF